MNLQKRTRQRAGETEAALKDVWAKGFGPPASPPRLSPFSLRVAVLEEWLASPGCAAVMVVWAPVEGVRSAWHTAVLELPPSFDPTLPMLPVLQATLPNEPRLSLLAKVTVPAGKAVILGAHVRLAVSGLSAIDLRWVALERRGRQHQATLSLKAALVARG